MTNTTKKKSKSERYSGYKKVSVEVEWTPIKCAKNEHIITSWYHPHTNEVKWFCERPYKKTHYEWISTAEFATGLKPQPMRTRVRYGFIKPT